jgi:hypothetical protein
VGKTVENRCRWVDNIKMDGEIRCVAMHWIYVAEVRDQWWTLVSSVINFNVP